MGKRFAGSTFLVLVVAGILACSGATHAEPDAEGDSVKTRDVSQKELLAMLEDGAAPEGVVLLDVRTVGEFEEGHIRGALLIPHDQIGDRLAELEAHREDEIILYCRSGRRVGIAAEVLAAAGFEKLAHLDGDMKGWLEKDLPVASGR
jgi:phage shock protein E